MELVHTLLFLMRENRLNEDLELAQKCLLSLEKSTYKTVVVYNQGFWTNEMVEDYLRPFDLNCIVIGDGVNVGTVKGRQSCFEAIWEQLPDTRFISEIHLDMIFTHHWEDPLVTYLETHDEPIISCGIVDQHGTLGFIGKKAPPPPGTLEQMDAYLSQLQEDAVVPGFTNPCIHKADILKETGGYHYQFLTGKQAFEDDSMLLGYYYYYGIRSHWKPKVCFHSVVYHAIAGQRLGMGDNVMVNYAGLVKQYGAMGIKHLAELHTSQWHINFFSGQFKSM